MNTQAVLDSLILMGKGMLAIFVVIVIIYFIVMLLIKLTGKRNDPEK